jgi:hypothetical protein
MRTGIGRKRPIPIRRANERSWSGVESGRGHLEFAIGFYVAFELGVALRAKWICDWA